MKLHETSRKTQALALDEILAGLVIVLGLPFVMALDLFDNLIGWAAK